MFYNLEETEIYQFILAIKNFSKKEEKKFKECINKNTTVLKYRAEKERTLFHVVVMAHNLDDKAKLAIIKLLQQYEEGRELLLWLDEEDKSFADLTDSVDIKKIFNHNIAKYQGGLARLKVVVKKQRDSNNQAKFGLSAQQENPSVDPQSHPILLKAIATNDLMEVKSYLAKKIKLDLNVCSVTFAGNQRTVTLLQFAVLLGKPKIALILLEYLKPEKIKLTDSGGKNIVQFADPANQKIINYITSNEIKIVFDEFLVLLTDLIYKEQFHTANFLLENSDHSLIDEAGGYIDFTKCEIIFSSEKVIIDRVKDFLKKYPNSKLKKCIFQSAFNAVLQADLSKLKNLVKFLSYDEVVAIKVQLPGHFTDNEVPMVTLLTYAVARKNFEIATYLLEDYPDLIKHSAVALELLLLNDGPEDFTLKFIHAYKDCLNQPLPLSSKTALTMAIAVNRLNIINAIIAVDQTTLMSVYEVNGYTVLHFAILYGREENIIVIINKLQLEKTVNAKSLKGFTPLILAATTNQLNICKILLQKGAKINLTDAEGKSALIWALERGHEKLALFLLDHGADREQTDNVNNWPPLLWAVHADCAKVVLALLAKGADILGYRFACDIKQELLALAEHFGKAEVARALTAQIAEEKKQKNLQQRLARKEAKEQKKHAELVAKHGLHKEAIAQPTGAAKASPLTFLNGYITAQDVLEYAEQHELVSTVRGHGGYLWWDDGHILANHVGAGQDEVTRLLRDYIKTATEHGDNGLKPWRGDLTAVLRFDGHADTQINCDQLFELKGPGSWRILVAKIPPDASAPASSAASQRDKVLNNFSRKSLLVPLLAFNHAEKLPEISKTVFDLSSPQQLLQQNQAVAVQQEQQQGQDRPTSSRLAMG